MSAKRKVFWLEWSADDGLWRIIGQEGSGCVRGSKAGAVRIAAGLARKYPPSQLKVRNKDGRIAFERTYGADPRRHRG